MKQQTNLLVLVFLVIKKTYRGTLLIFILRLSLYSFKTLTSKVTKNKIKQVAVFLGSKISR